MLLRLPSTLIRYHLYQIHKIHEQTHHDRKYENHWVENESVRRRLGLKILWTNCCIVHRSSFILHMCMQWKCVCLCRRQGIWNSSMSNDIISHWEQQGFLVYCITMTQIVPVKRVCTSFSPTIVLIFAFVWKWGGAVCGQTFVNAHMLLLCTLVHSFSTYSICKTIFLLTICKRKLREKLV